MTTYGQPDLAEGARLRDEGIARVTAHSDQFCIAAIDHCVDALNRSGDHWSANDLRVRVAYIWPEIAEAKPQLIGARVRAAAMRKEMRKVGRVPSTLPSTHAHEIALWQGVSR